MSESMNFLSAVMDGNEEAMYYATYLYEKAEKYRWHDLRKNPDDLPEIGRLVTCFCAGNQYQAMTIDKNKHWNTCIALFMTSFVIAWREIEPFEEE